MSVEWKPGDVADVWINDRHERAIVRVRRAAASGGLEFAYVNGGFDMTDDLAPGWSARPLVVIDPEDREAVERLVEIITRLNAPGPATYADRMQLALREFADPKPPALTEQPMDLAARVLDRDGDVWARQSGSSWGCLSTQSAPQAWMDLVNVCGPLRLMEVAQ